MADYKRYPVNRREFGHGQSSAMNPGRMESYGSESFRGWANPSNTGRDYEQNAGYRAHYDRLGDSDRPFHQRGERLPDRGEQRGKGPRSYRRTDNRILEDLNDRMCDNPYLDASDIEVNVNEGEVVLTGTVNDREAKRLAADISEEVSGVKNVENRLRVKIHGI